MTAFGDALAKASPEERERARLETRVAEVRRQRDAARTALKATEAENNTLAARLALVEQISDLKPRPPRWLTSKAKKRDHRATVCTILSDSHFDEVVNPDEIGGVNAYDRTIATARLRRYYDQVCTVSRDYMSGVTIDGIVAMLGGDLVGGEIHDELKETNEDTILGTVLYWSEMIAAGIGQFADHFGKVHVPCVVGNHGRRTRKPRSKGRARDNFDWLLCHMVAREFVGDNRVTFDIPDAFYTQFDVYDTVIRLEHGDQARGGSGWMGPLGPVMRRDAKIGAVAQAIKQPYDHLVVGHWHTYTSLPTATINGSSKGFDEFSATEGFSYEDPMQAMWLATPERGITMRAPVFVSDRKREKW